MATYIRIVDVAGRIEVNKVPFEYGDLTASHYLPPSFDILIEDSGSPLLRGPWDVFRDANGNTFGADLTAAVTALNNLFKVATGNVQSVSGTAPIQTAGTSAVVVSVDTATTSADGVMSAADKTKLDGIATGAEVNPASTDDVPEGSTNLYYTDLRASAIATARIAASSVLDLSDTPVSMGTAGQILQVNSGATALEFATNSGSAPVFLGVGLDGTTGEFVGSGNINMRVDDFFVITEGAGLGLMGLYRVNTQIQYPRSATYNAAALDFVNYASNFDIIGVGGEASLASLKTSPSGQSFQDTVAQFNLTATSFIVNALAIALTGSVNVIGTATATGALTGGSLVASGLNYPTADGNNGQVIATDGSGNLSFVNQSGGGGGGGTRYIQHTFSFFDSQVRDVYIPLRGESENTSVQRYARYICPVAGQVAKIMFMPTISRTSSTPFEMRVMKQTAGTANYTTLETETWLSHQAYQTTTLTFSSASAFSAGDILVFRMMNNSGLSFSNISGTILFEIT